MKPAELADAIERVLSTFYNDGTSTALVALERLVEELRPHEHSFDFFSRTIEACGDMHYYCECGQQEPCDD
jgi:hypothetical protein